jgi:DNA topoisomerase-1
LAEKSSAMRLISNALGEPSYIKCCGSGYNTLQHKGTKVIVGTACGHLFTLKESLPEKALPEAKDYSKDDDLITNFEWVGTWENPKYSYIKKYFNCLQYINKSNKFDRYIIATDNDIEGHLLGFIAFVKLNIDPSKLYWMQMNSLARYDILSAYENIKRPDFNWVHAGETRHIVDISFGFTLSRLFTKIFSKKIGKFRTLSLGRVQTPTLRFLTDREKEINNFVQQTYYKLDLNVTINGNNYIVHNDRVFNDRKEIEILVESLKNNKCIVKKVLSFEESIKPYYCFKLSTLQQEAWKYLRLKPSITDKIAQELYEFGLISYTRTDSTNIQGIPIETILQNLSSENKYKDIILLAQKGQPISGGEKDGSHLPIYPTGRDSSFLRKNDHIDLLDLITRRFLGVFLPDIILEKVSIIFEVGSETFKLDGQSIVDKPNWLMSYYYATPEENSVPTVVENQEILNYILKTREEKTKSPYRYSIASLIKEMSKQKVGTKSTRSEICEVLLKRKYVSELNNSLRPTQLGENLVNSATKLSLSVVDVSMTRELEENLEKIETGETQMEAVLEHSNNILRKSVEQIKANTEAISVELTKTTKALLIT